MDLITLDDLETALGYSASSSIESAEWQRHISALSDYINLDCDHAFSRTDDDVQRLQANYDGEIELPGRPVWDVTAVVDPRRTGMNDFYADWDQLNTIFNLAPQGVYDVTYSHGHTEVPDEIKNLVIQGCVSLIDGPESVTSFQVGDVQEKYSPALISQLFGAIGDTVLASFGGGNSIYTIKTSGTYYPDYRPLGYLYDTEREE